MTLMKNKIVKSFIFVLGILSVILGVIGAFLPLLPTTPFILLAAWCFLKSSKRAHAWIYRQPLFGKALLDWERNQSIARPTKIVAIATILISIIFIWMKVELSMVRYSVTLMLILISTFIITRNEGP